MYAGISKKKKRENRVKKKKPKETPWVHAFIEQEMTYSLD